MATEILLIIVSVLVSYLIGSINFAILISRLAIKRDIRKYGSGNAGATNVVRTVGLFAGIVTFLLDFLKGVLAAYFGGMVISAIGASMGAGFLNQSTGALLCGLLAQLGHIFPVFFGFKGGKGISCSAGILLVADWKVFVCSLAVFLIAFLPSKIISLASISASTLAPVFLIVFTPRFSEIDIYIIALLSITLGFVAVYKHKDNIKRLKNREEKAISFKKK